MCRSVTIFSPGKGMNMRKHFRKAVLLVEQVGRRKQTHRFQLLFHFDLNKMAML